MARCPRCRTPLGLMTSFALANFRQPFGLHAPNPRIEFECYGCGTILTYRYETAGLCWVLAIVGLLVAAVSWSQLGTWGTWLVVVGLLIYWLVLASLFSFYTPPLVANPPRENHF